jgi:predicted branched-subunit amino acid permease
LLTAQFVIDETTAMHMAESDPRLRKIAFWTTAISLYALWNLGTLLGALAGSALDPEQFGLDVAFTAAFVAMLAPHLTRRRARLAAALGGVICVATIPFLPIGLPVLLSGVAIFVGIPAGGDES